LCLHGASGLAAMWVSRASLTVVLWSMTPWSCVGTDPDQRVEISLARAQVTRNDLHKGGSIVYEGVGELEGRQLTLEVTSPNYVPSEQAEKRNGKHRKMGIVNIQEGGTTLKFKLYDTSSIPHRQISNPWFFTVCDIDQNDKATEEVEVQLSQIGGNCFLSDDTAIENVLYAGSVAFKSTVYGDLRDNSAAPEIIKNCVMCDARSGELSVYFSVTDTESKAAKRQRNFLFTGKTWLDNGGVPVPVQPDPVLP
jgi:hypothetical protein